MRSPAREPLELFEEVNEQIGLNCILQISFDDEEIGDAVVVDTSNSLIFSTHRLVTAVGMDNVAIVETGDAVLVVDKQKDSL